MIYFLIILMLVLLSAAIAGVLAAPYVPTRRKDVERFLHFANINQGDIVCDLGCGDGRILKSAKKQGAKPIGYELSLLNFLFCRARGLKVKFKNFFNGNFENADIVYMFLSQKAHNKMGAILKSQMKKGSKIICYVWQIEGFKPEKIDKAPKQPNFYLYRM